MLPLGLHSCSFGCVRPVPYLPVFGGSIPDNFYYKNHELFLPVFYVFGNSCNYDTATLVLRSLIK